MNVRSGNWKKSALVLALGALALPAQAAGPWKVTVWGPQRSSTQPFEWYAKEAAAKTGGQLKMEFTYGASKPTDAADLLKSGSADGAYFCSSYFGEKMPLVTVLDLPMFAPDSIPALAKVETALM